MTNSLVVSLSVFLFIAAITPGPNNLLLTSSGAHVGLKRSLTLMAGIIVGMQCVLLSSAFGIATLLIIYPALHIGLKLSLIHISEPTRPPVASRMPSSA